ncbi:hypothetical protein SK069_11540 [Patulibacter brassicae]|uniref:Uncharacterized protein n=1 Tax=Patulibacter brassicae TaxID=1705717 RepID=A0ABU4VK58_9ACTN|nr:hypothetical protein [Patulibacter brassicae]MDX8152231.1 hypothetical protein [Patulibacter brassicae]
MTFARPALLAAATGAALAVGLAAGAAPAGASLTFVKDHDVWLAHDDGSGAVRVTTDGTAENPWQSPSQADDGTIVAARKLPRSGPLFVLRQNGELVRRIDLPAVQFGPFDPAVSPDGTLVAYGHSFARYVNGWLETGSDIRYARTDGTGGTESWPGVATNASTPSWIDARHVLAARGTVAYDQRPDESPTQWWSDYDHQGTFDHGEDLSDGEVAGGRIVVVRGTGTPNTLQVYRVAGRLGTPTPTCTIHDPADGPLGRAYKDPTLSADGRRIWWQEGDGIWTATTPAGDGCEGWDVRRIVDGASEPDWSPAAVSPGPRGGGGTGDGTGGGTGDGAGAGGGTGRPAPGAGGAPATGAPAARAALKGRVTTAALRRGLVLSVRTTKAGTVRTTATTGARTIARRSTKVRRAGTTTVRLPRLRASVARRLRGTAVRITVRGAGVSTTLRATVR